MERLTEKTECEECHKEFTRLAEGVGHKKRFCNSCVKERNRKRSRERYKVIGKSLKEYTQVCSVCNKEFSFTSFNVGRRKYCTECSKKRKAEQRKQIGSIYKLDQSAKKLRMALFLFGHRLRKRYGSKDDEQMVAEKLAAKKSGQSGANQCLNGTLDLFKDNGSGSVDVLKRLVSDSATKEDGESNPDSVKETGGGGDPV